MLKPKPFFKIPELKKKKKKVSVTIKVIIFNFHFQYPIKKKAKTCSDCIVSNSRANDARVIGCRICT